MENNNLAIIYILSSNKDKFREIELYLKENLNFEVKVIQVNNLPVNEIQGDGFEIVEDKCKTAIRMMMNNYYKNDFCDCDCVRKRSIILVEDTSFGLESMNGLPGAYIRDFFLKLGNTKIFDLFFCFNQKTFKCDKDKTKSLISETIVAQEDCYIAITRDNNDDIITFKGSCEGIIIPPDNEPQDEFNWNFFFVPNGAKISYGKMTSDEKNKFSARKEALNKLCLYLNNNINYLILN